MTSTQKGSPEYILLKQSTEKLFGSTCLFHLRVIIQIPVNFGLGHQHRNISGTKRNLYHSSNSNDNKQISYLYLNRSNAVNLSTSLPGPYLSKSWEGGREQSRQIQFLPPLLNRAHTSIIFSRRFWRKLAVHNVTANSQPSFFQTYSGSFSANHKPYRLD